MSSDTAQPTVADLRARLVGRLVVVEPLVAGHEAGLFDAAGDGPIFGWMPEDLRASREGLRSWLHWSLDAARSGRDVPFAILAAQSGRVVGSTRFLEIRLEHLRVEIGWTWLAKSVWGTGVNVETKLLLLTQAFDVAGCRRVEFKTDARNERSRGALDALGAKFEGVLRKHMVVQHGAERDSAYYSVIDDEWPALKTSLQRRLQRASAMSRVPRAHPRASGMSVPGGYAEPMRAPVTLDLHLPNFNYPDTAADQVFDKLVEIATTAEQSGFSSISLMDHFHQIPGVGPQTNWMFEGPTMLAALAARTSQLTFGLLVGGVTYRNPAHHAKITTTLDVLSGGRAWHALGAAWFEDEHRAYGFEFPPLKERFERLDEALQIARAMFREGSATFDGRHFHVHGALNNPRPLRGDIPIVVGGSGERKTLRLVAQYADGCNVFGNVERARHLLSVLESHCDEVGRDPTEITKTRMTVVAIAPTHEQAVAKLEEMRRAGTPEERVASVLAGDAEEVAEQAHAFAEIGIEGMTLSLPDVHDLETVALAGRTLGPVFASAVS